MENIIALVMAIVLANTVLKKENFPGWVTFAIMALAFVYPTLSIPISVIGFVGYYALNANRDNRLDQQQHRRMQPINFDRLDAQNQDRDSGQKQCTHCEKQLPRNAIICQHCGRDQMVAPSPNASEEMVELYEQFIDRLKQAEQDGEYIFLGDSEEEPTLLAAHLTTDTDAVAEPHPTQSLPHPSDRFLRLADKAKSIGMNRIEEKILVFTAAGYDPASIADEIGIRQTTVVGLQQNLRSRFQAETNDELVELSIASGILTEIE